MIHSSSTVILEGVPVEIQRKNIKYLHLYVLPPDGRIRISAPLRLTDDGIAEFIRSKQDWIRKQQEKIAQFPCPAEPGYESGEPLYLFGKRYILSVEYTSGKSSVYLCGDKAVLAVRPENTSVQRETIVKEWYRGLLKEQIEVLLPKWENITGLYCDSWQTKNMKTRWGTCNTRTRKIWLNLQLAKKPTECLEYVILHELAHLKVPHHGLKFEAVLNRYMPDWRERKKLLNTPDGQPQSEQMI